MGAPIMPPPIMGIYCIAPIAAACAQGRVERCRSWAGGGRAGEPHTHARTQADRQAGRQGRPHFQASAGAQVQKQTRGAPAHRLLRRRLRGRGRGAALGAAGLGARRTAAAAAAAGGPRRASRGLCCQHLHAGKHHAAHHLRVQHHLRVGGRGGAGAGAQGNESAATHHRAAGGRDSTARCQVAARGQQQRTAPELPQRRHSAQNRAPDPASN